MLKSPYTFIILSIIVAMTLSKSEQTVSFINTRLAKVKATRSSFSRKLYKLSGKTESLFCSFYLGIAMSKKMAKTWGMACPKKNWCRSISAVDFAYALANYRPELKLDKSVSQSAARFQMLSHHMSKPWETHTCPSDFHHTHLTRITFHFNYISYSEGPFFASFLHNGGFKW